MPKRLGLTDQLRQALEARIVKESAYAIAKATGIPQESLSRFRAGTRGLSEGYLDELADYLRLELRKRR